MMIRLEGLTRSFDGRFTLGPLSLEFGTGVTCVVGPNGAGKTTLFGLIAGLDRPTSGRVVIEGSVRGVGFLPQVFRLPPRATCRQFLEYVAWLHKVPKASRGGRVDRVLEAVGLEDRAGRPIGELSGGMVRRLGIAQALVHDPALVLLDEPTAGLDPVQRVVLRDLVGSLAGERGILVSTHLVEDIRGLAERVVVLNQGEVLFDGSVAELQALAVPDTPGGSDLERALSRLILQEGR